MYSTAGVLPVPPSVKLPTLITGTGARCARFQPQSYSQFLAATTAAYGQLVTRSPIRTSAAPTPRLRPLTIARYSCSQVLATGGPLPGISREHSYNGAAKTPQSQLICG